MVLFIVLSEVHTLPQNELVLKTFYQWIKIYILDILDSCVWFIVLCNLVPRDG